MRGQSVVQAVGYPDQMQAREAMIDEFHKLGSKAAFCEKIGLSRRYVNLIMEWKRAPTHWKILQYFGWTAVYAVAEDLIEPSLKQKPGRKPLSVSEGIERRLAIDPEKRRAYWRQKQREFRERRKQIHAL